MPSTDFHALLRRFLAQSESQDRGQREAVYHAARQALGARFSRADRSQRYQLAYELDQAIADVEKEAKAAEEERHAEAARIAAESARLINEQRIPRLVERLTQIWNVLQRAGKTAGIVAAAVVIASALYWFLQSPDTSLPRVQRSALEQTACSRISTDQCDFLVAAIERTKSRSIISAANAGDIRPAEQVVQKRVREIEADPSVDAATRQIAATEAMVLGLALQRMQRRNNITTESIDKSAPKAEASRRVASEDPRKELESLGKNWSEQNFLQNMASCDVRAVRLYKQAGMGLPRSKALEVLALPQNAECLEEYRDQFVALGSDLCFSSDFADPSYYPDTRPVDWIRKGFEIPARRKFIESLCGEARLRETYPELYAGKSKSLSMLQLEMRSRAPLTVDDEKANRERIARLFPGVSPPQQGSKNATASSDVALGGQDIRSSLMSRLVTHGDAVHFYHPDGRFEMGYDRTRVFDGTYRIEADGRVCWKLAQQGPQSQPGEGCFVYYRRNGMMRVRRQDTADRSDVGLVTIR